VKPEETQYLGTLEATPDSKDFIAFQKILELLPWH